MRQRGGETARTQVGLRQKQREIERVRVLRGEREYGKKRKGRRRVEFDKRWTGRESETYSQREREGESGGGKHREWERERERERGRGRRRGIFKPSKSLEGKKIMLMGRGAHQLPETFEYFPPGQM